MELSEKLFIFANGKTITMIEEPLYEYDYIGEEEDLTFKVESVPWRGIAVELEELHYLQGARFVRQLKLITYYGEFHPIEGETDIFSTGGERDDDYANLLNAARKAVDHGYKVFILPNPKEFRTADFIFERKGIYKMYDLKTIQGRGSAFNRLAESIGQVNHVLLNITSDYDARLLASDIKSYFEINNDAVEVLIFKGKKQISIDRDFTLGPQYHRLFRKRYEK